MNWIRPAKRLGIYLRDGLACVWCAEGIEDGAVLTLDHLHPYADGGANGTTNLVTACRRCNSSRGRRSVGAFARAVATYLDHRVDALEIAAHVRATVCQPVDLPAAKDLIARRGFRAALRRARRMSND